MTVRSPSSRRLCDVYDVHGPDLGKSVFQVHGVDIHGKVVTQRLRRDAVPVFFANLAPCVVSLEAYAESHFRERGIVRFGHTGHLMTLKGKR
jgi:transposase